MSDRPDPTEVVAETIVAQMSAYLLGEADFDSTDCAAAVVAALREAGHLTEYRQIGWAWRYEETPGVWSYSFTTDPDVANGAWLPLFVRQETEQQ